MVLYTLEMVSSVLTFEKCCDVHEMRFTATYVFVFSVMLHINIDYFNLYAKCQGMHIR